MDKSLGCSQPQFPAQKGEKRSRAGKASRKHDSLFRTRSSLLEGCKHKRRTRGLSPRSWPEEAGLQSLFACVQAGARHPSDP